MLNTISSHDVATRELCRNVVVQTVLSAIFIQAHGAILVLGCWAKFSWLDAWQIYHKTDNFVLLDSCLVKDACEDIFDFGQGEHESFTNYIMNDLIVG